MTDTAFWDKIAPRYAKSPISNPGAYEDTLSRVRSYLRPDDDVLELGCGTGSTALLLADAVASYEATDISRAMIDIAKGKLGDHKGKSPAFRVAGVSAVEYADSTPDVVLAFNLLHLIPDLEAALKMIHDLLPEDGVFISKSAALSEKWYYGPMIGAMRLIGKAPFVRRFKVDEIDALIADAGFRIVETGLYPPSTPSRFVVARKI